MGKAQRKIREGIYDDNAKLLTKDQAAAVLGISYRTIERWRNNRYIRLVRVGSRMYVPYSEIYRIRDQFIDRKANGNYLSPYFKSLHDLYLPQSQYDRL